MHAKVSAKKVLQCRVQSDKWLQLLTAEHMYLHDIHDKSLPEMRGVMAVET